VNKRDEGLNTTYSFASSMVSQTIKNIIKHTFLYEIISPIWQKIELRSWEKKGKPFPLPRLMKQGLIKEYARRFSIHTLIETGTYLGDMVNATKSDFKEIFSIELDNALWKRAKKRFAGFKHISIIHGSSANVLPKVLSNVTWPCLFWLDAHYSGGITAKDNLDSPIMEELRCILDQPSEDYVILIDDARKFVGQNTYPTLEKVKDLIVKSHPNWVFEVKDDIIRIHKKLN
jgi:hypothetical protein